jgi:hypothetical protein
VQLEVRVTRAYEEFIAPGEFAFRARDNASRLGNAVKFTWEMVPTNGGEAAGVGLEILILDDDGRIRIDHQFIEGERGQRLDDRGGGTEGQLVGGVDGSMPPSVGLRVWVPGVRQPAHRVKARRITPARVEVRW